MSQAAAPKASTKMKKPTEWRLAFNAKYGIQHMPEPSHRVPPQGVTAGISFRAMPKSCVEQVRDICLFYVDKCSGQYQNNKQAARYVHQMAEEVINQLAGVASDIKRHVDEPEVLQKLLDEWNESFPASLGDVGTPKAIAAKLEQQRRQIEDLEQTLDQERTLHETDITGILRSVDAQLDASRKGVQSERRQLALKTQFATNQAAQTLAELKKQHETELRNIQEKTRQDRVIDEVSHKSQLDEMQSKMRQMEEDFNIEKSLFTATLAKEKSHYKRSQAKLHKKYKILGERYANLRAGVGAMGEGGDVGGTVMETEVAKDAEGNIVTDEAGNPVMVSVSRRSAESPSSGRGSPYGDKSVGSASSYGRSGSTGSCDEDAEGNAVDRAQLNLIKRLRQQHFETVQDLQKTVQELTRQKENVVNLLDTMKQLSSRNETLKDENAALHCTIDIHLAALHRDKENNKESEEELKILKSSKRHVTHEHNISLTVQGGKLIEAKPKVLNHNPDLLQHTRKLAL